MKIPHVKHSSLLNRSLPRIFVMMARYTKKLKLNHPIPQRDEKIYNMRLSLFLQI